MGKAASKPQEIVGLENFAANCYVNSILQVLYSNTEFRQLLLGENRPQYGSLFRALKHLFARMETSTVAVEPRQFLRRLKRKHVAFRGPSQQDAHEFYACLINDLSEDLSAVSVENWVKEYTQGSLTYETQCLNCGNISKSSELFVDLPVEVQGLCTDVSRALGYMSRKEKLKGKNKFDCEKCKGPQKAERRAFITKFPKMICLHLKRFTYSPLARKYIRLGTRVEFPTELTIPSSWCTGAATAGGQFTLIGVIVHIGDSLSSGHYVSCVKVDSKWKLCDDDKIMVSLYR